MCTIYGSMSHSRQLVCNDSSKLPHMRHTCWRSLAFLIHSNPEQKGRFLATHIPRPGGGDK